MTPFLCNKCDRICTGSITTWQQQQLPLQKREAARKILLNDSKTTSKFREGTPRTYLDLLIGRFDVKETFRIKRREDNKTTISNKWTDLSRQTIKQLIEQGREDASEEIAKKPIPL